MTIDTFLQIFILVCFIALIVVLFFERLDYLTYSLVIIIIAGIITGVFKPEARTLEFYVGAIDWEVIFFLIGMFTIVEVLNEKKIFQELSKKITEKYSNSIRRLFYLLCITSTLIASILEDLSVQCGEGVLRIEKIKPACGKEMSWQDFVNGRRVRPGDRMMDRPEA